MARLSCASHVRLHREETGEHLPSTKCLLLMQSLYQARDISYMKHLVTSLYLRLLNDRRGQDLIEYALMAGFVALAAGAIMPGVATSISTVFSKVASVTASAASQGS